MARKTVDIVTCDRCTHTTTNPVDASTLVVVQQGVASFGDLCPKCTKRVIALTEEILAPKKQAPKKVSEDDAAEE